MAAPDPVDLLDGFKGHSVEFDLMWRQEQSRTAGGRTIVKDLGSPLWRARYRSAPMLADDLDVWRARLNALENGLRTFYGRSISRLRPIGNPGTAALPTGTLSDVASDRKSIEVSGLPGVVLQAGDLIQIGARDLHQVVGVSGSELEVRPHLWPGVTAGAVVKVERPHCVMAIVPGSAHSPADLASGIGSVSFDAVEVR